LLVSRNRFRESERRVKRKTRRAGIVTIPAMGGAGSDHDLAQHPHQPERPPTRDHGLFTTRAGSWMVLLIGILLCLSPMVIRLGERLSTHTMENVALLSSQETWLRLHEGERGAWLIPSIELEPRLRKPPMLVWLHLLAWADLDPATATPEQLTLRARVVSVALGVILIASVFWLGTSLLGTRYGFLAMLVAGANIFVERQARTASYDVHIAAWSALAVAFAFWAMKVRPAGLSTLALSNSLPADPGLQSRRETAPPTLRREVAGWIGAGLTLAAAMLTKGPLPLLFFSVPVAAAIVLLPQRRARRSIGAATALVIAGAATAWWYIAIWSTVPGAAEIWALEYSEERSSQPFWYYLGFLGLMIPWTLWFIAGLVHPFMPTDARTRRHRLIALLWLAIPLVLLSIPGTKQQRYVLPLVAAAALLIARVFEDHEVERRLQGRVATGRLLRTVHWSAMVGASVLFGIYLIFGSRLKAWAQRIEGLDRQLITEWQTLPPLATGLAVAAGALLLAVAVFGWRWHARHRSFVAGVVIALWMVLATTIGWNQYSQSPTDRVGLFAESARQAADLIGDRPLFALKIDPDEQVLNEEFRFYFNRLIRSVTPDALIGGGLPSHILVEEGRGFDGTMQGLGFEKAATFQTDRNRYHGLWTRGDSQVR